MHKLEGTSEYLLQDAVEKRKKHTSFSSKQKRTAESLSWPENGIAPMPRYPVRQMERSTVTYATTIEL